MAYPIPFENKQRHMSCRYPFYGNHIKGFHPTYAMFLQESMLEFFAYSEQINLMRDEGYQAENSIQPL